MKSLKSKVILSAVVLIFALVATIGSTFAWFTVSSTVSATALTLNVTTADSLLIKVADLDTTIDQVAVGVDLDPATYDTSLSFSDFSDLLGYDGIETWVMNPATIIEPAYAGSTVTALQTIGSTTARLLTNSTNFNSGTGVAIQLKFWVMAQATNDLYLNSLTVDGTDGTASVDEGVEQSLRMVVTSRGNHTGLLYGNDIDYTYTFFGTSLAAVAAFTDSNFNALAQHSLGAAAIAEAEAFEGVQGSSVTPGTIIQSLSANEPVAVFVTIFIEGWDSDATNYIIGAPVTIAFEFTIA